MSKSASRQRAVKMAPEGYRVCRHCYSTRPIENFWVRKDTGKHRLRCKDCLIMILREEAGLPALETVYEGSD